MSVRLELASGGEVELVALAGEGATLELEQPAPPGAPIELVVLGAPARLKVRRCQRVGNEGTPRFRIEGRWISLSRAQRESLRI
jgi:hypothetical protein